MAASRPQSTSSTNSPAQPICLIHGGRWRNHSRMEREKVGDLRRADELRLVCVEDAHRRAVIAPYDVLHVVHYFAGAKVEDNLTQRWQRLHSRPAVGEMKANVLGGAFRREQCPGTKEEATSPSSTSASMCASTV